MTPEQAGLVPLDMEPALLAADALEQVHAACILATGQPFACRSCQREGRRLFVRGMQQVILASMTGAAIWQVLEPGA